MNIARSAGGIVLGDKGTIALVCVRGSNGAFLFPKGHVEEGETDEAAARREIAEETGLHDIERLDDLGSYRRPHLRRDGTEDPNDIKDIHMFLFAAPLGATLSPSHEIEHADWFSYQSVASILGNDVDRAWYARVFPRVREAIQRD
jgi:diadenosine hexaphosphate hydrolase (ATP-forming)